VRGFATFRTRGSSRGGRNSSRNSQQQYDDDADDGGEEREVGLDAVRDEQGRRIIDPMGAALNSSSSSSRRRGGWRGDEEQEDGGEVDVDEERANDALMRQLAERNNRPPSAGSRAQVADAAFLRQQAAAQQARVEEAQRSGAPASQQQQQQHQPQRDEWAFDEDVGISDDYESVSKPHSSSRVGRGGSVVPFPDDGDDGSSVEATSYLPASSATYQAQRQRKREMQREQERRAEQQRMRDPAAEAYRPYRPYNEHRADAFASPNDVGSPSSSVAAPQRPKYTSSRASPAQLAWQKQQQQQLQREQGGNDQWSTPAAAPPQQQQQQQQQQQAEDMHEEARAASRRDQLAARDQSARAKYAARHGLGAAAVASPSAPSSAGAAASSPPAVTTSSTPVPPAVSSSFSPSSSSSHSAVSEQPMRSFAQREMQRAAAVEKAAEEEENWSIPQPSDWEHAIPDPDRDQALRRERKREKLQRNRDKFLDGEEGDFIEPRPPRPLPREERQHTDGWSQGGRGGNSRFSSRGGGSFGRPQHTERDGDFVAAHDADGFRERVTYSPRRGSSGGDASRAPLQQRGNREEFSSFSAPTRPSGPVKGQMRTVSGRKARREEAEALAAQRLSEPREQDIPRPDGLRGATAAERYAATSIAATFRSGASSKTSAATPPPAMRLGGSSSAARDPTAAPTTRPWSRQVQDLMKSRGATFHGELLYGVHPVLCALQADRRPNFHHLYLQDNKAARLSGRLSGQPPTDLAAQEAIVSLARAKGIGISYLSKHDLHLLSDGRPHNGFALDVDPIRLPVVHAAHDLEREFEALRQKKQQQHEQEATEKRQVWVLLDEVMDPQNLGAMLRSCLYFSVDGVLLCARNSAPLSATTSKASSGAQEFLPLYEASATPRLLHKLDRAKWNVVGLSLAPESIDMRDLAKTIAKNNANNAADAAHSAQPSSVPAEVAQDGAVESVAESAEAHSTEASSSPTISSYRGPKHVLFVVGNEGRGLRPVVARACDVLVKIVGHGGSATSSSSSSNTMAEIEDDTQRANADALAAAAERVNAEDEADEAANDHVHAPHSSFSNQPKFGRANERGAASTRVLAAGDPRAMVDSLNVSNALAVALYELSR
jgi:tRNA G18 (ribose-2'-O)-methylase SpoU